jgi:hypothetical protein
MRVCVQDAAFLRQATSILAERFNAVITVSDKAGEFDEFIHDRWRIDRSRIC